jgi:hypothetical protein
MWASPSSVTLGGHGGFQAGGLQCAHRVRPPRVDRAGRSTEREADRASVARPFRRGLEPGIAPGLSAVSENRASALVRGGGDDRARGERGVLDRAAAVRLLRRPDVAALDAAGLGARDGRRLRADGARAELRGAARSRGRDGPRRRRLSSRGLQDRHRRRRREEGDRALLVFAGRQRRHRAGAAGDHGARHRHRPDGEPRSSRADPRRLRALARSPAGVLAERGAPGRAPWRC